MTRPVVEFGEPAREGTGSDWDTVSVLFTGLVDSYVDDGAYIVRVLPPGGDPDRPLGVCYPLRRLIELDGGMFGVPPDTIDPVWISDRERYAAAWGVFCHEAGHARHTQWVVLTGEQERCSALWAAAMLLEEIRMEARTVTVRPGDRRWLRAAARLLFDGLEGSGREWDWAKVALLVLGRVDAGVLDGSETEPVERLLGDRFGDRLGLMREVWRSVLGVADDDPDGMFEAARRWCEVTATDPGSADPDRVHVGGSTGPGGPGRVDPPGPGEPGGGDLDAGSEGDVSGLGDAVMSVADTVTGSVTGGGNEELLEVLLEARAAERAEEAQARERAREMAAAVFGAHRQVLSGDRDPVWVERVPTDTERKAAHRLADRLRRAQFRERHMVVVSSKAPPGKLRFRAALQVSAERALGLPGSAEPWRRPQRRHAPFPPLHVGLALDVSGSMRWAVKPLGSAAWIVATAVSHCEGLTATVCFGEKITPVTALVGPHEAPRKVREFPARDGYEMFCEAVDALDGTLNLGIPGRAARLLVVVSDGQFTNAQRSDGQRRVDRLTRTGCGVLWLCRDDVRAEPMNGAVFVALTDPAEAINEIADAAVRALERA